jgi:hypothetical protein
MNETLAMFTKHLYRNAKSLAEVITLSRAFMSSTAKAKTAKLSVYSNVDYIQKQYLTTLPSSHPSRLFQ